LQKLWGTKELTRKIANRISKSLEECNQIIWSLFPSFTPGLLSLTSGGRKITKLDDRRLTLWHEKVEETKALVPPGKNVEGDVSLLP